MRVSSFSRPMGSGCLSVLALAAATIVPSVASAADMFHTATGAGEGIIVVTGDMVQSDAAKFRGIAANYRTATVVFASKGGALSAGLSMGDTIRARKFTTSVSSGAVCASACALAWLGGENRAMSASARIGFHASFTIEDGAARESAVGNALVGAYITRLGLPIDMVIHATQASPREMAWLSTADAARLGIDVTITDAKPAKPAARDRVAATAGTSGGAGPMMESIPSEISRTGRRLPATGEGGAS